ncbi:hypothetical protein ISF_07954 [Cordyceps fumosorosea ARSEF 2679]|uniref:Uncharacterized protein n=1 Tax=Cordyceps fumosorosea (strain ARSEF 2679) TaxID=1081104 RepID=A0A167NDS5_CORFA|nr:hypothetical protein ISF_07954 [Cordyceps fumosorosea ARSEF 2679]OAA55443.1 hypothetical protein ISF_07954 [Cordyceps fumosorosea ARSEF 2679]
MRFQVLAPAALLVGITNAKPTNSTAASVSLYPDTGFVGTTVAWPVDGQCHDIADKAPKLKAVGSIKVYGNALCHLHE